MKQKQQRRPSTRPDEILDAALEVFTAKGFAAARMDDIAKKAGLTKGSVYLYFSSKEQLFEQLIDRFASTFMMTVTNRVKEMSAVDPVDALRGAIKMALMALNDPILSAAPRLALSEGERFPKLAEVYRTKVVNVGKAALVGLLKVGCQQGVFRPISPDVAIRQIMGPLIAHMALTYILRVPLDMDLNAFEEELTEQLINSICVKRQ